MARTKNITPDTVESVRSFLQKLALKPKTISVQELVKQVADEISVALEQRYTYAELAQELSDKQGIARIADASSGSR